MPEQYTRIKKSYMDKGDDEDDAKRKAAMTFIKRGKGGTKSSRAKALQSDKYQRRKPKASYPMPKDRK